MRHHLRRTSSTKVEGGAIRQMWRTALSPVIKNQVLLKPLIITSAIFIIHNTYRIHLLRTHQILLSSYLRDYPIPLTSALLHALHARYQAFFFAVHLYLVPVWTVLAMHQITNRQWITPRLHAYAGGLLVMTSILLAYSSIRIVSKPRAEAALLSFRNGCVGFLAWWGVCLVGLRGRAHKFWGMQLVAVGFGTALLRVGVFLWLWGLGGVVDEDRYERVVGGAMCLSVVMNPMLVTWVWGVAWPRHASCLKRLL